MNKSAKLICTVLLSILMGCNSTIRESDNHTTSHSSATNHSNSQNDQPGITLEPEAKNAEPEALEGTNPELFGVDENLKSIFQDNFSVVSKAHEDMIYRKSNDVQRMSEAFFRDRPDLRNAKLTYDAKNNAAYFVYQYTPTPDDLDMDSDPNFMTVRIGSYFYISNAVGDYFRKCKIDLAELGIAFDMPQFYVIFHVDNNYYLGMYRISEYQLQLEVKLPQHEEPVTVLGSLPTARMTLGVAKPQQTVSGTHSNQQALIDFFGPRD